MASMLQVITLGVPCICLLWNIPRAYFVVMVMVISCTSGMVLGFMFTPKVIHTRKWLKEKKVEKKKRLSDSGKIILPESVPSAHEHDGDAGLKIAVMKEPKFISQTHATAASNVINNAHMLDATAKHHIEEEKREEAVDYINDNDSSASKEVNKHASGDTINNVEEDDMVSVLFLHLQTLIIFPFHLTQIHLYTLSSDS